MRPPARHPRNRDAAVRRKRKARHALSGKPVPNPLPRSAVVEEAPGHEGKWRARPSDSQGRDLTHEKSRRDPHLARAEPDEAVRTGRNITRIALVSEAGRDGFWLDLWRLILFRKIPKYPVSGTEGSNPSSSSIESANHRFLSCSVSSVYGRGSSSSSSTWSGGFRPLESRGRRSVPLWRCPCRRGAPSCECPSPPPGKPVQQPPARVIADGELGEPRDHSRWGRHRADRALSPRGAIDRGVKRAQLSR